MSEVGCSNYYLPGVKGSAPTGTDFSNECHTSNVTYIIDTTIRNDNHVLQAVLSKGGEGVRQLGV